MESLVLKVAPPLDPAWVAYEEQGHLKNADKRAYASPLDRQPVYAAECRALTARMTAPSARDFHLPQGVATSTFTVPSSQDGFPIPVKQYDLADQQQQEPGSIVCYIHGGGLHVGEADSEELSCLRILKEARLPAQPVRVVSVGYRLMPAYSAQMSVLDCADVFQHLLQRTVAPAAGWQPSIFLIGSSSGGQLAALLSQSAPRGSVAGIVLRCPVTSDAFSDSGLSYVPARLRPLHTSAWESSFFNSLLGRMVRDKPRDGLPRMPLEVPEDELKGLGLPRTWIQVCTNDGLYSDGVCYAKLLEDAGVDVKVDVVKGWPHTFWLKAPELPRALEAERAMLEGLAWVAGSE